MTTMTIPEKCTVLVVGGGPGGSYAAAVLARENIDTVVLEADKMPRYHIGESMLPSFRHYLKFIDLHTKFDNAGFTIKHGAAFKMNPQNREGLGRIVTDFRSPSEDNRAWNVVRSEGDEIMFRHAGEQGAKIFDGVKVNSFEFDTSEVDANDESPHAALGRPTAATWTSKAGTTGTIKFDYVVDASGRAGILSTRYMKNRSYSKALKNVANWAYFSGAGVYGAGTNRAGVPLFEAFRDESGWAWFIPLHNGTHSIGVVMNQEIATKKKKAGTDGLTTQQFYDDALKQAPMLLEILGPNAKQVTAVNSGADFSYHAKSYAIPYARIVGDAGCFIDPFFSSGVHLATTGGLSAATTICASIRGDATEAAASKWHSTKIRESYARFLMVVLSAYQQMRNQEQPVLSDVGEDNFDRAFKFLKPVIQGTADATKAFTQEELSKTIHFLSTALQPAFNPGPEGSISNVEDKRAYENSSVSAEDIEAMQALTSHHIEDTSGVGRFTADVIDGFMPRMERGNLTLVKAEALAM
ncbi:Flavine halogenase aclH [Lachnellula suecica]|uniref:Flavine halogenase aclH n=1 Tax=Lachnellula suecica TaxID=602035 RepID=A0A8T9CG84_9HELO|nr:Flavine halogenase aclH [Lachnellula suecica]